MAEQHSPLAGVTCPPGVAEIPFRTQLNLRLDPAAAALDLPLPTRPCTSVRSGDIDVLWLGPDEWLVVGPPGAAARLTARLRPAAGHGSVVDVSAQRTTLHLTGPHVRDLLAAGCAVDIDVLPVGACVQTTLAHTPVILVRRDEGFWVLVRASYAAHLADWLLDASVEHT